MVELHEASEVQKTVESLGKLQQQQNQQGMTVPTEPNTQLSTEPTISEAGVWANNLIVSPSSVYISNERQGTQP